MSRRHLILCACALPLAFTATAQAHSVRVQPVPTRFVAAINAAMSEAVTAGSLEISGYWAKAMLPGQPTGGGYLAITNKGKDADRLLSVTSPAAGMVEI